eukprot:353950-Chlamydomonas_euryale.AAC.10
MLSRVSASSRLGFSRPAPPARTAEASAWYAVSCPSRTTQLRDSVASVLSTQRRGASQAPDSNFVSRKYCAARHKWLRCARYMTGGDDF